MPPNRGGSHDTDGIRSIPAQLTQYQQISVPADKDHANTSRMSYVCSTFSDKIKSKRSA